MVRLPDQDIKVSCGERRPIFTLTLRAKSASVEAVTLYVGNGGVAVELRADESKSAFFQGEKLEAGQVFKKESKVQVLPGFKRVEDLAPGTVCVELPGVTFELPK